MGSCWSVSTLLFNVCKVARNPETSDGSLSYGDIWPRYGSMLGSDGVSETVSSVGPEAAPVGSPTSNVSLFEIFRPSVGLLTFFGGTWGCLPHLLSFFLASMGCVNDCWLLVACKGRW